MSLLSRLGSLLRSAVRAPAQRPAPVRAPGAPTALADRTGDAPLHITYAPRDDDRPDPGEIVWAWVPFEEDLRQGKDRPVLVLAEEAASAGGSDGSGRVLIALMLTSRDHARTGQVSRDRYGAIWVDIGAGAWDRQGRPSEVRADRLLRLEPGSIRRVGARLEESRFARVVAAVRETSRPRG